MSRSISFSSPASNGRAFFLMEVVAPFSVDQDSG